MVAGDVTTERVRALAEKYYGPVPARPVPSRQMLAEPPKVAATRLEMTSDRVASAQWSRSYLAPSFLDADGRSGDALEVLAELLGGGTSSRLYRSLVIEKKLATSAGAVYYGQRGTGSFMTYAEPRQGVSVADLEAALVAEVGAFLREGALAADVERVKQRLQASAIYSRDSLSGPARIIGASLAMGRTLDQVEAWPERIGAVTPDQVTSLAREILKDDVAVTAILLPGKRS